MKRVYNSAAIRRMEQAVDHGEEEVIYQRNGRTCRSIVCGTALERLKLRAFLLEFYHGRRGRTRHETAPANRYGEPS